MNRTFTLLAVVILALLGIGAVYAGNLSKEKNSSASNTWGTKENEYVLRGIFEGTLPCADCPGIKTELQLIQYGVGISEGIYTLTEIYLEKPESLVSKGTWTTERGTNKNKNAVVIALSPEDGGNTEYFEQISDSVLRMLLPGKKIIESRLPYELYKVR